MKIGNAAHKLGDHSFLVARKVPVLQDRKCWDEIPDDTAFQCEALLTLGWCAHFLQHHSDAFYRLPVNRMGLILTMLSTDTPSRKKDSPLLDAELTCVNMFLFLRGLP